MDRRCKPQMTTVEGAGSGSTGLKAATGRLIPGHPSIPQHSSTCLYSWWLPSRHVLAEEFGCFGQRCLAWVVFWEKRVRKHEHKNCRIRKPDTAWKSILQCFWEKVLRKELRRYYLKEICYFYLEHCLWVVWMFMFSELEVFSKRLTFLTMGNTASFTFYSLLLLSLVPLDPSTDNCPACVPLAPPGCSSSTGSSPTLPRGNLGNPHPAFLQPLSLVKFFG